MIHEFIEQGGSLYVMVRKVKESSNPIIDTWKEHLHTDKVFRKDGMLYFCRSVDDAEFTEIKEEDGQD